MEVATQAITFLNGFRLGGSTLSVAVAKFPRVAVAGLGEDAKRVQGAAVLDGISKTTREAKDCRTFSEDEDNMLVGLPRDGSPSCCFHPFVLFPEISSCRVDDVLELEEGMALSCDDPSHEDLRASSRICVDSSDMGVSHGSGCFPLAQDQVKFPKPRGRPRKAEKGGIKKKEKMQLKNWTSGTTRAEDAAEVAEPIGKELMVLPAERSEPYDILTRARSAVLMGKRLGMTFDCTDGVAEYQIAAQIRARAR